MKLISKIRDTERWSQAIAILALSFAFCFGMNLPASADTGMGNDTDISTGSETTSSANSCQSSDILTNYDKRFPFSKDMHSCDTLEPVQGQAQDQNSGATPRLQQSQLNFDPQIGPDPALMQVVGNQSNGYYSQPFTPEKQTVATKKDTAIFHNLMKTKGLPLTDTNFQVLHRENQQRYMEMYFDPERTMWQNSNQAQLQGASASNSFAGAASGGFSGAVSGIQSGTGGGEGGAGGSSIMGALINIANENAGTPTLSDAQWKPISGAVWMVQQMYKFVFVPMAILFLLPGAVLTQVKGQVASGILGQQSPSPFEGILRAMIAVFLIPATQLIMSYAIDVGNSLTYSVNDYVDTSVINSWTQQTIYDVPVANVDNAILPPSGSGSSSGTSSSGSGNGATSAVDGFISSSIGSSGLSSAIGSTGSSFVIGALTSAVNSILGGTNPFGFGAGGDGLAVNTPDGKAIQERQLWTSQTMELVLNAAIYFFSIAVLILGAYQLVFMCYLYLLGPLAAAFFAWPVIGGNAAAPNSSVFSGWVDAVIVVSLWRFYWMVILAIMTQRILWMMDTGQQLNLQWEVTVFICLLGLMMYVPFHPWDYDPGKAFTQAMQAGQQLAQAAGPGMGQAAAAAGVPQSQINAVGNAFNQVGSDSKGLIDNQTGANAEAARGQAIGGSGSSSPGGPLAMMGVTNAPPDSGTGQQGSQTHTQPQPTSVPATTAVTGSVVSNNGTSTGGTKTETGNDKTTAADKLKAQPDVTKAKDAADDSHPTSTPPPVTNGGPTSTPAVPPTNGAPTSTPAVPPTNGAPTSTPAVPPTPPQTPPPPPTPPQTPPPPTK